MATQATLLKIYVGEHVQWEGKPLYQAIFFKLKDAGLDGVTITRGIEGFGQLKAVHTARLLELAADLPMIVECVDFSDKIEAVLPEIRMMVPRGRILTTDVMVHNFDQIPPLGVGQYARDGEYHIEQ
ncbi:DUF190 domain-containing protein [Desulfosporosinus sp. PR]|uniref:DUF190 domain-containing protein n=1 Tax=Candidatus Desulfosporosinus nitrosoreducens TaxID=3401928 RepID=UPI0027F14866|nr:DUF190 domain-containing protein [Desulfosporosinus sp. PR]MDQ7096366.1 DUF190 domain-containing protein [Desulfosporosinus sp. PR]